MCQRRQEHPHRIVAAARAGGVYRVLFDILRSDAGPRVARDHYFDGVLNDGSDLRSWELQSFSIQHDDMNRKDQSFAIDCKSCAVGRVTLVVLSGMKMIDLVCFGPSLVGVLLAKDVRKNVEGMPVAVRSKKPSPVVL